MLQEELKSKPSKAQMQQKATASSFKFPHNFYGDENYWLKNSLFMRLILLVYLLIYLPNRLMLIIQRILGPFDKLNTVI